MQRGILIVQTIKHNQAITYCCWWPTLIVFSFFKWTWNVKHVQNYLIICWIRKRNWLLSIFRNDWITWYQWLWNWKIFTSCWLPHIKQYYKKLNITSGNWVGQFDWISMLLICLILLWQKQISAKCKHWHKIWSSKRSESILSICKNSNS